MMLSKYRATIELPAIATPEMNSLTTFLNPWSYVQIRRHRGLLDQFNRIYLDGISMVIIARLFGIKVNRVSFDMTSLAPKIFEECCKSNLRVALVGSTEDNIMKASLNIKKKFPHLQISEIRSGYFESTIRMHEYCQFLIKTNVDVVIVGMGAVLQEKFLLTLRSLNWQGAGYTCGGFFHQTADTITYYPKIIDQLQLRWAYRIFKEPKLFLRYSIQYPKFIFILLFDTLSKRD